MVTIFRDIVVLIAVFYSEGTTSIPLGLWDCSSPVLRTISLSSECLVAKSGQHSYKGSNRPRARRDDRCCLLFLLLFMLLSHQTVIRRLLPKKCILLLYLHLEVEWAGSVVVMILVIYAGIIRSILFDSLYNVTYSKTAVLILIVVLASDLDLPMHVRGRTRRELPLLYFVKLAPNVCRSCPCPAVVAEYLYQDVHTRTCGTDCFSFFFRFAFLFLILSLSYELGLPNNG